MKGDINFTIKSHEIVKVLPLQCVWGEKREGDFAIARAISNKPTPSSRSLLYTCAHNYVYVHNTDYIIFLENQSSRERNRIFSLAYRERKRVKARDIAKNNLTRKYRNALSAEKRVI